MEQYKYKEIDEAFAAKQSARFGKLPPPIVQKVYIGGPLDVRIEHYGPKDDCIGIAFRPFDNPKPPHEILKKEGYRLWKIFGMPNHKGIQKAMAVKDILPNDPKIEEKGNTIIYKIDLEDQELIAKARPPIGYWGKSMRI